MAVKKHLQIGNLHYSLKQDLPITRSRKEQLDKHPQRSDFYFTKSSKQFYWYVLTTRDSSTMSTTAREENELLKASYNKWLNKKKDIDDLPIWD